MFKNQGRTTMKKISKKSLEYKKNDTQYRVHRLKSVKDSGDYWELEIEEGPFLSCLKSGDFIPRPGMVTKFYGKGFGYPIRGVDIAYQIMYYRTPQEAEEDHKKTCEKQERGKKKNFKKNKKNLDKDYNNLPHLFKQRIDKFRKNNSDFRWKYEAYEMFCCKDAVKIANALKTVDEIQRWEKLALKEQKKTVDIDDGHSGNTFQCAVSLACLYLSPCPENVVKIYGALAPLVGSKEYGCIPKDDMELSIPKEIKDDFVGHIKSIEKRVQEIGSAELIKMLEQKAEEK